MRTIERYLAQGVYGSTLFVFAAFLALFAFFDLINELGDIGKGEYRLQHAIGFVLMSIPAHVYELFPIAVLIGTLYSLAQLAAHSEYTVMRVSGLSPGRAALMLIRIGTAFVAVTFIVGEFLVPVSERAARTLKLSKTTGIVAQEFRTGLWVKDEGRFVNIREVRPDSNLSDIRIYDFDSQYRLQSISFAKAGRYLGDNRWALAEVVQTRFSESGASVVRIGQYDWASVLTPELLSVLFVDPARMSAWNLYQYSRHLGENRQKTERYEIAMWMKIVYPFAVLVMMGLALPFAYIHTRGGSVGIKVFSGIMIGVLFNMLNNLFAHLGMLKGWAPSLSAAMPSLVFLLTAALMMWWVERR
ncbi:MAG: LPS export ABC transporter permease LptG [Betaproteobacteria bacterium]|nr:LPS export ABC transporter permease LptG [Betaproteobacteria bacterium]